MSNGLAKTGGVTGSIELREMSDVWAMADRLSKARGFVPAAYVGQPEALAACILTGLELGMGPMEAMRSLHIIEGRPTLTADAMLARAIRAGVRPQWLRSDATEARVRLTRSGFEPFELAFTMEDAGRAGLSGRGTWKKYPHAMLRARAVSAALRAYCPDVLGAGVYTPEELDGMAPEAEAPRAEVVDRVPETAEVVPDGPAGMAADFDRAAADSARLRQKHRDERVPYIDWDALEDARDGLGVVTWCREHGPAMRTLTNGSRERARDKVVAACDRVGVEWESASAAINGDAYTEPNEDGEFSDAALEDGEVSDG